MELRTFLRLSVFYYDQLPIKSYLVVLSQKRGGKKSLGGNEFSWMILWAWEHSPEAEFSSRRVNLASVLQLPARDGASQNQHGVFQLTSAPAPPPLPVPCHLLSCGCPLWEAPHSQACGTPIWPSGLWVAQVHGFLKNSRIKYLRSATQLPVNSLLREPPPPISQDTC